MFAHRLVPLALALSLASGGSAQQTIGVFVDTLRREAVVFDADADTILGAVPVPGGSFTGCADCAILADLSLAFVVTLNSEVWVIDLTTSPPSLAAGTNPIPISNSGEDVVISPDQRYLLVCGEDARQPLSVVDIAARAEVGTYSFSPRSNSVDVGADGSVLVSSTVGMTVERLTLDALGVLSSTGEVQTFVRSPNNSYVAPGAQYGVTFLRGSNRVVSYELLGLAKVDITALSGSGSAVCGAFDPLGDDLYTVTATGGNVTIVERHAFEPSTGEVDDAPAWSTTLGGSSRCYGVEQLALHPNDEKLYVSQTDLRQVSILDAADGAVIGTFPLGEGIPSGVCVVRAAECFLVLGDGAGNASFQSGGSGGHEWDTQLGTVWSSYPVTIDDIPSFPLPDLPDRATNAEPTRLHEVALQVVMWNPTMFPTNPEQSSERLDVALWSNGRVTARRSGAQDGIELEFEVVRHSDGSRSLRFPFSIDGL